MLLGDWTCYFVFVLFKKQNKTKTGPTCTNELQLYSYCSTLNVWDDEKFI
jgi:hypothetical protein